MPIEHAAPIEFEGKILDIDSEAAERLILDKGGQKLGERFMRRYVYDITPGDQSKWIRLRSSEPLSEGPPPPGDTGNETTLTVKEITSDAIHGTHEIEGGVDDFATANALLGMLGFTPKSYLEIEAGFKDEVMRVAGLLGYTEADLTGENTIKIRLSSSAPRLGHLVRT